MASTFLKLRENLAPRYKSEDANLGLILFIWEEISRDPDFFKFSTSASEIQRFLGKYFSKSVIGAVLANFSLLHESTLGVDYFVRGGLGVFGLRALVDNDGGGECQTLRSGGARDGGSGDRGYSGDGTSRYFHSVRMIDVPLSHFVTPERGAPRRSIFIRERAHLFMSHQMVTQVHHVHYDPFHGEDGGAVTLYHGFRARPWSGFCTHGITSPLIPNEFHMGPAFYVSNHIGHAFEHPLHQHPRRYVGDTIWVFVFRVQTAILHGLEAPPGDNKPFKVLWFEDHDDSWQLFCAANISASSDDPARPRSEFTCGSYDIVIGPSCIPKGGFRVDPLCLDGIVPTQVAFCTKRAWMWIGSCAELVLREICIV